MKGYVYILECTGNKLYIGSTNDLAVRYEQHQLGLSANFTRKNRPIKIVYVEIFDRIDEAFEREKQLQGWSRKKKEALIKSDFNSLHLFSECDNASHANSIYSHNSLSEKSDLLKS